MKTDQEYKNLEAERHRYATSDAGLIMIDRLRFAGTVLILAVCALMTVTAITRVFS